MLQDGIAPFTLPPWITADLTTADIKIFYRIFSLLNWRAKIAPEKSLYIWPSQTWLGQETGYCRETVSRSIQRLQAAGLIRIIHRRPENGRWTTNLYMIGNWLIRFVRRISQSLIVPINRVTKKSHKLLSSDSNNYKVNSDKVGYKGPTDLLDIIERCKLLAAERNKE